MANLDDKQNATAARLVEQIRDARANSSAVWNLAGTVGTGKTSVLRLVRQMLATDLVPLMVTAPGDEVDAAPIALLEMAGQLKTANLLNGEMATIDDPSRAWADKFDAVTNVVEKNWERVVILCDEPTRWYHQHKSLLGDTPDAIARKLAEWISEQTRCRRVISGWIPGNVSALHRTFAPRSWMTVAQLSLPTRSSGVRPLDWPRRCSVTLPAPVPERSPWEMKLCVAHFTVQARERSGNACYVQ